ncbi:MAG TPA: methionine biosynthesis protein MetW [bacterium]|nr:methionine biosynthesis protein MetW [bacterium]HNS48789.1 methionine biosynthesis protein MetW [bacterium]
MENLSPEYRVIVDLVRPNSTVLDLGCGNGRLLCLLKQEKEVKGQGIEISLEKISECVHQGVNVLHGDLDNGLAEYPDKSFDYVILNNSIPELRSPRIAIKEGLRVGRELIVGFPNFAHWRARCQLGLFGRVPVTDSLPHQWFDTPNRHFLSINDFVAFCRSERIRVNSSIHLCGRRRVRFAPNLLADYALFLLN